MQCFGGGAVGHVPVDVIAVNIVDPCLFMKSEPDTDTPKTCCLQIRSEYKTTDRVYKQSQAKRQMLTAYQSATEQSSDVLSAALLGR